MYTDAVIWNEGKELNISSKEFIFNKCFDAVNMNVAPLPKEKPIDKSNRWSGLTFTGKVKPEDIDIVRACIHKKLYTKKQLTKGLGFEKPATVNSISYRGIGAKYTSPFEVTDKYNFTSIDEDLLNDWLVENKTKMDELEKIIRN